MLATSHNGLQPLVPGAQYLNFAFNLIGPNVMADQSSGFFTARFVPYHSRYDFEREAHIHQHRSYCAPKVVSGELVNRQLAAIALISSDRHGLRLKWFRFRP